MERARRATNRRRLLIALAAAAVLHTAAAALIPARGHESAAPVRVVTRQIALLRRPPTPPPTPRPTPASTPTPIASATVPPHPTLAPHVIHQPAPKAASQPRRQGGAAAHLHVVPPHVAGTAAPRSLAENTHAGVQSGGSGTGAGPGNGTGGEGGAGSGTGGLGNGNGGTANAGPCGDVYLLPGPVAYRRDGTVVQTVLAKVVFGDGDVEVGAFPYPFVYPAERLNPFTHESATLPGRTIPLQMPPAGTDVSDAPKAVQIALHYTNPATGTTTLPECAATPAPAG